MRGFSIFVSQMVKTNQKQGHKLPPLTTIH